MKSFSKKDKSSKGLNSFRWWCVGAALLLIAGAGMVSVIGCKNGMPGVGTYGAPVSQVDRDTVADCSNLLAYTTPVPPLVNPTLNTLVKDVNNKAVLNYPINPNLFEMNNPPAYTLKNPNTASITVLNNFAGYCGFTSSGWGLVGLGQGTGPGGDSYAYRMSGSVTDLGDATFEELDLCAYLEAGSFFDARNFTGVQFYFKIAPDDTSIQRHFAVPVYQTIAVAGGGGCTAGPSLCYDHFAADISGGTNGQWEFFRFNFSDLKQLVGGAIPTPASLSGTNLEQIMWLQWSASRNNKPGVSNVDFYVDQISFFK
jgi:hypothetical protein